MMIITPAAKLDSEPCRESPIAKPAAARIAANDVVSERRSVAEIATYRGFDD